MQQLSQQRSPAQTRAKALGQRARQDERMARYEPILELQKQGMKSAEIAQKLGVTPRTIQRWIATGDIPYSRPRKERVRLIDPYKVSILERLQQGCRNKAQLERELRTKGYKGSGRAMYPSLATLEPTGFPPRDRASAAVSIQPNPLLTLSAQQATWLFFRKPGDWKEEEQENLRQLRQASPEIETTYQLVEAFLYMVRKRKGEQLDAWLAAVQASHLEAFDPFVTGVQKDKKSGICRINVALEQWSDGAEM